MGDPCDVESFGRAYEISVEERSDVLHGTLGIDKLLVADCPVTGNTGDVSRTKYVDDITKLHIGGGPSCVEFDSGLAELSSTKHYSNQLCDEALKGGVWARNRDKQNANVSLIGQGAVSASWRARAMGSHLFVWRRAASYASLGGGGHGYTQQEL